MSARTLSAFVLGVGLLAATPAVEATPNCAVHPNSRLIQWPTASPVWEFCMLTPVFSSSNTGAGSGIELRDVYYNGHLVFKRAHAPILNVLYQTGCGCYRDWSDQEVKFRVKDPSGVPINPAGSGNYYETNFPAETVCETGGSGGDIPPGTSGFRGVSAEKTGDPLVLTTQMQAGWYRYAMRWKFYMDGRIQPWYGYSAVPASCISHAHTHHNYWRLDFDIDGAANDTIQKAPSGAGVPGRTNIEELVAREMSSLIKPTFNWAVSDKVTRRGFRVVPGTIVPADNFAVSDSWALLYKPNELDDNGAGGCPLNFSALLNNEPTDDQDVVLWVRGGQFHQANELDDCGISGYTLEPFGDWAP